MTDESENKKVRVSVDMPDGSTRAWTTDDHGTHTPEPKPSPMTLRRVQRINANRCDRWHVNGVQSWSGLEWAGAMCGEAGEAANIAKKLRRLEMQLRGNDVDKGHGFLVAALAEECADVILYCALLATHYGIDLETAVRNKFNKKSVEQNFPERL